MLETVPVVTHRQSCSIPRYLLVELVTAQKLTSRRVTGTDNSFVALEALLTNSPYLLPLGPRLL